MNGGCTAAYVLFAGGYRKNLLRHVMDKTSKKMLHKETDEGILRSAGEE
jgi:hypothetical protein